MVARTRKKAVVKWKVLLLIPGIVFSFRVLGQTPARPLVTHAVDETKLVTLQGSVHPLTKAGTDVGAVADSFPAERLILLLNRPPEREAALQQFLREAHTHGSASYHKWLTPDQFGAQFGPAGEDIQTATDWLSSHGFQVARISKGKQFIEFSGTAGQLREAFHTQIHQYSVNGETHYANATEVKIPAALAALVGGVSPMNDFRAKPQLKVAGKALYSRSTHKTTPQWTVPNGNQSFYAVAPEDFFTQYDLAPLYKAGVNGAGQTIGVINESNIDLSLVQAYQKLFGIGGAIPQVVIDGDDPGTLDGVDVEAYLDIELGGAVAPGATVNLYIAGASNLVDPLELAALRAVEDNQASVLSVSFGLCEDELGNAGNQSWASLWEQAAAQGQTVLVSAGDTGSQCSIQPDWVNGLASTPWDVAVGGTDFYYSDFATGGASAATLWNLTNDGNLGSLIAPLPEQVWNDGFGFDLLSKEIWTFEQAAGGGGASNCSMPPVSTSASCAGYTKPSWQTGPGVPADGVRDLPDVSLFASNGANLSAYAICAAEGECAPGSGGNVEVYLVGGTSASVQAMAGIMALVNQQYGRQGQANYTLYPLAQQKPAAFHDITLGSNVVECQVFQLPAVGCVANADVGYVSTQYYAGPGYDQASGLGSVDAKRAGEQLEHAHLSTDEDHAAAVQHKRRARHAVHHNDFRGPGFRIGYAHRRRGHPDRLDLAGKPIAVVIPLSGGTGTSSVNYLPGGEYQSDWPLWRRGSFASSTSTAETLTVTPEKSNINFSF